MMIPTSTAHNLINFYVPWAMAVTLAGDADQETAGAGGQLVLQLDGLEVPALQLALAIAGVLLARPLAPRREGERGLLRQVLVSIIMVVVTAIWVIESRPGLLFTFVVAIGLGFSGYALIELAGEQIQAAARRLLGTITDAIGRIGGKDK